MNNDDYGSTMQTKMWKEKEKKTKGIQNENSNRIKRKSSIGNA